jgi:hypothetical protein
VSVSPRLAAAAVLVVALTGCGGTADRPSAGGQIPESARFAPEDTTDFFVVNTDFGGRQWTTLERLASRFPDSDRLTAGIRRALRHEGIEWADARAALGPEVGVASFGEAGIALTEPRDDPRLAALVASLSAHAGTPPLISRSVDGWRLVSDGRASLDAAEKARAGRSFADRDDASHAFGELPADALVRFFSGHADQTETAPERGLDWVGTTAGSLEARDDGLELNVIRTPETGGSGYAPKLAASVPADALAFVSFDGGSAESLFGGGSSSGTTLFLLGLAGDTSRGVDEYLAPDESLAALFRLGSLVSGEGVVYVRRGSPLPEVTLLLGEPEPQAALAKLDALARKEARRLGTGVEATEVDGVPAKRLTVKGVPVYYALLDGRLVITDSRSGVDGLTEQGPRLADDVRFRDATRAAGVPDEVTWLAYADVHDLAPLLGDIAALTGDTLPTEVAPNLRSIQAFTAFGIPDGDENRVTALLQVR